MRVLMLSQFYPPTVGGEERHVQSLSQALSLRGHEVAVATLADPDRDALHWDGPVAVHGLPSTFGRLGGAYREAARRHAPPVADPEVTRGLRDLIADFQPDVVHAHNWIVHSFLPLKRADGPPLVMTLHAYGLRCVTMRAMREEGECPRPEIGSCLRCASSHFGTVKGADRRDVTPADPAVLGAVGGYVPAGQRSRRQAQSSR